MRQVLKCYQNKVFCYSDSISRIFLVPQINCEFTHSLSYKLNINIIILKVIRQRNVFLTRRIRYEVYPSPTTITACIIDGVSCQIVLYLIFSKRK